MSQSVALSHSNYLTRTKESVTVLTEQQGQSKHIFHGKSPCTVSPQNTPPSYSLV